MNNPMMNMLMKALGPQAQQMMTKWEGMTAEQRQQEMGKIQRMTPQERNNILMQNGINPSAINANVAPQNTNTRRKFNY